MKINKMILSNKGFTLVELVAVIMVLSLILAVAVPRILHSIEESQREALRLTAKNIEKAARDRLQMSQDFEIENKFFTIENGEFVGDSILLSGELPNSGTIYVRTDGEIGLAISDGKFCLIKKETDDEIIINKDTDNCELILETPAHCFYYQQVGNTEIEISYYKNRHYYYEEVDKECTSDLIIPKRIDGMTVVGIGEGALNNQQEISCETKKDDNQILSYNGTPNINKEDSLLALTNSYECGSTVYRERWGESITSVVFPNSIRYIGANAFKYNLLKSVTFPESVEYIGEGAFLYNELEDIIIPSTVKEIGNGAFNDNLLPANKAFIYARNEDGSIDNTKLISYGGNNSEDVTIPSNIKTIGEYAFTDYFFNKIVIPNTVETIEEDAFVNNSLVNIEIPEDIDITEDSISYSFYSSYVDYYEGLAGTYTSLCQDCTWKHSTLAAPPVSESCFSYSYYDQSEVEITGYNPNCPKDVVIPSTLGGGNVVGILDYAFSDKNLISVVFPNTIDFIGHYAFSNNKLTSVTIPNSVTTIASYAFEDNLLTNLIMPNSVTTMEERAFARNHLTSVTISNNLKILDDYVFYDNQLTSVTIPNGVTHIKYEAFQNNQLTSVTIPNSVTYIGGSAFSGNQLTSISIPNSVTYIGIYAFHNNQLTSITIPSSITAINYYTFAYNQLTNVTIPNSVIYISEGAFRSNQLTSISISSSVISIGRSAFNNNQLPDNQAFIYARNSDGTIDNTKLVSYGGAKRANVVIPNNVTYIGDSVFAYGEITSITIPNSVTTIWTSALTNNNLTNIVIPNSVTTIGSYSFNNNNLTNLVIPNSVTTIGSNAFSWNNLVNVVIPDSVTTIGSYAFYGNQLTSVTLPSNLSIIQEYTFSKNKLTNITIPDSVTKIANGAFSDNNLTSITIPSGVEVFDRVLNQYYNWINPSVSRSFYTAYVVNKHKAGGTYTSTDQDGTWTKQ